ncbi:MAG: RNA polymerase sigma factor [Candidatus Thiodiazotropha sp. (ex Notomyrtea botanica)]|nr:RNA polymerase sigma factor [Candidatus Thiodiazotropha sp. (ex Notomyrtea botanica)]
MRKRHQPDKMLLRDRIADSRERLYRVALAWCNDEMLADDLAQETVATDIAKRQQLQDPSKMFAWLYTILNNKWHRYLQQKKLLYDTLDDQLPSHHSGPSAQCQELELVARVRHVVATLPMKERQVISLIDLEELTYGDVGKALNIPIGTVMSRLHRARKRFMEKIEDTTSTCLVQES